MATFDGSTLSTAEETGTATRGLSRRSLVKAGAVTAWTVPLVTVVGAAPAVATSHPGGATLAVEGDARYHEAQHRITVDLTVTNSGDGSTSGLTVTMKFPSASYGEVTVSAGWTAARSGNTYTFTALSQLDGGETIQLQASFALQRQAAGAGTQIDVVAQSYSPAPAMTAISVTAR